jgi:hypothetical protein
MQIDRIVLPSRDAKPLSNRAFGLIFAGIFLFFSVLPLLAGRGTINILPAYVSLGFASFALVLPRMLSPMNALWGRFGLLMHRVTNPVLMGLVFFLTIVPTGLVLRLLQKDPMQRRLDEDKDSYWTLRDNGKFTKDSFDNQF